MVGVAEDQHLRLGVYHCLGDLTQRDVSQALSWLVVWRKPP